MDLRDLLSMQRTFDDEHGWSTKIPDLGTRLGAIEKDLIGLLGELGEAANCVKKFRLHYDKGIPVQQVYEQVLPDLRVELVDAFIYLIRLMDLVEIDLEREYLDKLAANRERYRAL